HHVAETLGQTGKGARVPAIGQQLVGAEGAGGDHHAARGERSLAPAHPGPGGLGDHLVAVGAVRRSPWADRRGLALREDLDSPALREPEIVLDEGVLGAVAAPHHAAPAANAAGARRAVAAEVRVRDLGTGLAEEDADPRRLEGVADSDLLSVLPK